MEPCLLDAAGATRQGRLHERNEDAFLLLDASDELVRRRGRGQLFAVCDGVSAAADGLWAARTTCERLRNFVDPDLPASLDGLLQLVNEIDWELRGHGHGKAACTLAVLWLAGGAAHVLHVGDSEVLRLRHGVVQRITRAKEGRRLKSYMGMGPRVAEAVQSWSEPVYPGDVYFLVTDGVLDVLEPEDLGESWWAAGGRASYCCERVLGQVDRQRGADDATIVVVDVLALPEGFFP